MFTLGQKWVAAGCSPSGHPYDNSLVLERTGKTFVSTYETVTNDSPRTEVKFRPLKVKFTVLH